MVDATTMDPSAPSSLSKERRYRRTRNERRQNLANLLYFMNLHLRISSSQIFSTTNLQYLLLRSLFDMHDSNPVPASGWQRHYDHRRQHHRLALAYTHIDQSISIPYESLSAWEAYAGRMEITWAFILRKLAATAVTLLAAKSEHFDT